MRGKAITLVNFSLDRNKLIYEYCKNLIMNINYNMENKCDIEDILCSEFWPNEEELYEEANIINELKIGEDQIGGKKKLKWKTLEHNGVMFPEKYVKHGTGLIYDGVDIKLNIEAEEYATIYARYKETEYIKNKKFRDNFWKDWKKLLDNNLRAIIKDFSKCDFSKIYDHIVSEKEKTANLTKEEKLAIKERKEKKAEKYKWALVDGKKERVGNYMVEPPGIFIGRGCHPKLGRIKKRILPSDIIINIGRMTSIPKLKEGEKWGKVIHDRYSEWLAAWKDSITGKMKYVRLSGESGFKTSNDLKKFNLSRKLKKNIGKIRKQIEMDINSDNKVTKQLGTATYMLDNFAIRVGNEKGNDTADTVGLTNLRVEHIKLGGENNITLDFLGKDSIRYKQKHKISKEVYMNLEKFTKGKKGDEQLFDEIDSSVLNGYLQKLMRGLTAKVFRTYNASNLLQKEINKIERKKIDESDILVLFNKANAKVAILCNHQKKVSKNFSNQMDKINERITDYKKNIESIRRKQRNRIKKGLKESKQFKNRIKNLNEKIKELRAKKKIKMELKSISLETSKANYIDPRIIYAFSKRNKIPIEKFYSKTLIEKFTWANEVDESWKY